MRIKGIVVRSVPCCIAINTGNLKYRECGRQRKCQNLKHRNRTAGEPGIFWGVGGGGNQGGKKHEIRALKAQAYQLAHSYVPVVVCVATPLSKKTTPENDLLSFYNHWSKGPSLSPLHKYDKLDPITGGGA